MNRKDTLLVCQILYISEEQTFKRVGKPDFKKKMISLETDDGQKLYCELRKLQLLNNIQVGDIVDVGISFHASEKGNKRYNNIFINKLAKK